MRAKRKQGISLELISHMFFSRWKIERFWFGLPSPSLFVVVFVKQNVEFVCWSPEEVGKGPMFLAVFVCSCVRLFVRVFVCSRFKQSDWLSVPEEVSFCSNSSRDRY